MKRLLLLAVLGLYACGPMDDTTGTNTGSISSDGGCSDTWSSYGSGFFSSTCGGSCHGSLYTTQANVQSARSQISTAISSGRMPKGGGLTSSSKARVLTYLSCGAP
jgi:hypothetical protein